MKTGLNELLRRQRGLDGIRTGRLPDNVKLPVMTPPEMRSLEQQLDSHEVYSQLVSAAQLPICPACLHVPALYFCFMLRRVSGSVECVY